MIGWGTLLALDPVVAQAVGARDEPAIARGLQRGVILAGLVSIPTMLGLLLVAPALRAIGQPSELIPDASRYIYIIIPGVLPFYLFITFRQTLQALEHRAATHCTGYRACSMDVWRHSANAASSCPRRWSSRISGAATAT